MSRIDLAIAERIADNVLRAGVARNFLPLTVAVLDAGGHLIVLKRADGSSNLRPRIAIAKAAGCLALGFGGRELAQRAATVPAFINAVGQLAPDGLLPVPGGVLVRDAAGVLLGAVGVTGDTSDNDETCAVIAVTGAGFEPDTGA